MKEEEEEEEEEAGIGKLPEHVVIEIFIRAGVWEWPQISCVSKKWASVFRSNSFWQGALSFSYPFFSNNSWPGPIPPPLNPKRRFMALYITHHLFASDPQTEEVIGHCYLFLRDQLNLHPSLMPPHSGILHGTLIDQFIGCGKSRDVAHDLASRIWLAVLDNLHEDHHTFSLLKRLAQEGDIFLPYPYTRSVTVQWRVFEKLFTDFRDCFNDVDYYDILACAKSRFHPIPSAWLGR